MDCANRERLILRLLWTVISLAAGFPVVGCVLGAAAWGGINKVVVVYLVVSIVGFFRISVGVFAVFFERRVLAWITCWSGLAIATMSLILAYGFLFRRAREVPLSDPLYIGGFHAPTLVFYGTAFVCCAVEALLYWPPIRTSTMAWIQA